MSAYTTTPLVHRRKRVRFTSSDPSLSDESALASTSVGEPSTEASDLDSDSGSELSSSSEEPSDESSSEEDSSDDGDDTEMEDNTERGANTAPLNPTVENVRANRGTKPVMRLDKEELGPDIRSFLKDFLPQLKAANEELEMQRKAGTLRSLDAEPEEEDAPYIEMDLGLGVLEAKEPGAPDSDGSASEESGDEGEGKKDVLDKLLGRAKAREVVGIEVVKDGKVQD